MGPSGVNGSGALVTDILNFCVRVLVIQFGKATVTDQSRSRRFENDGISGKMLGLAAEAQIER